MEQGVEQEVRAFGKETLPVWEASGKAGVNSYVEFVQKFEVEGEGAVSLRLGCDSRAAVYVNEMLVGLALFDGTQTICTYETFDLGEPGEDVLVKGTNVLRVVVYYQGKVSNHYTPRRPELIFQVEQSVSDTATKDVSGSGLHTRSRYWKAISREQRRPTRWALTGAMTQERSFRILPL